MNDRGDELDLLLHALRELLDLLVQPGTELHVVEPLVDALARGLLPDALDRGEEVEVIDDLHAAVEAALLGQIPDLVLSLAIHRLAENPDLARVGGGDVHRHPDRGRLARAVRPEEAEDRAPRNLEGEIVDRPELSERLRHPYQLDRIVHICLVVSYGLTRPGLQGTIAYRSWMGRPAGRPAGTRVFPAGRRASAARAGSRVKTRGGTRSGDARIRRSDRPERCWSG